MPQIMKAYFPQPMLFKKNRKMLCDVTRLNPVAHFIYIDIVTVFLAVRTSAELSIHFLLRFHPKQEFFKRRDKRQGAMTGFGFCSVLFNYPAFAVYAHLCDCMADREVFFLKSIALHFSPTTSLRRKP